VALGVEGMPAGTVVRKVVLLAFGTALLAASITAMFVSMRAVMDIGGSCASGGPYVTANTCPDGTWLTPVGIFAGLGACVLMVAGTFPAGGPRPVVFAWPATFLALGWNFWEYGLNPPGSSGVVWGWIICGVVFVVMGGLPLIPIVKNLRGVLWSGPPLKAVPPMVDRVRPRSTGRRSTPSPPARAHATTSVPATGAATPATAVDEREQEHVVHRLERLAALYRRGDLTVEEYQAAKAAVLGTDTP
jgi:hypothetical protein